MKFAPFALALFVLALSGCCHSDTETGTGSFQCETCSLRTIPVDLVCTKNAESAAQQNATAKARARCTSPNSLYVGAFDITTPAECVKRGNQWFVDVTVTGHFKCCTP